MGDPQFCESTRLECRAVFFEKKEATMRSFHMAVQIDSALWAVTFVSEFGCHETRIMTGAEFIEMISAEAELGC
ncbi:hypothetical protein BAE36_24830 [Rhizobium leguminosarum bv. trifolii]|uniref:Uncharacterized protein n=1 Tax=Rhizobium leguminosarum bv. trifolii TaxID=386 RepID=A0A1B8R6J6_RHILT|nr:hypothetical protein [Rhizobium leguminosarum bv. trifolii]OBY04441.1 hypothetical protein BAE36_24830 [Rhizobium leguminosarum bv. trifolii]